MVDEALRSSSLTHDYDSIVKEDNSRNENNEDATGCIWQHVLSVGRDGRCLVQSFVRGMYI
jgi:hypothetical protein